MHDDVAEIGDEPLAGGEAVHGQSLDIVLRFQAALQLAGKGLQVRLRGARGDDKEIREGGEGAEIERDDADGFFVVEDAGAEPDEGFRIQGAVPW